VAVGVRIDEAWNDCKARGVDPLYVVESVRRPSWDECLNRISRN
jgi:hypothetical protein